VDSLKLRITPKVPSPSRSCRPAWCGSSGPQRALHPDEIEPGRRLPLLAVLHGAGRREELLMKAYRDGPSAGRRCSWCRAPSMTWDLITTPPRRGAAPRRRRRALD
jgi:hypothetical protein